jgi:hypothetical protein
MKKGSRSCLSRGAQRDTPYAEGCLAGFAGAFFFVYFWRNFSTRPAVSTIFCLPV